MATKRIATGQITIVDLNDGKAVQAYTQASKGDTQIYNPDTKEYNPDYKTSNQIVTAKVYVTGSSVDQAPLSTCSGWKWSVNGTAVTSTGDISFSKNVLTIKKNIDPSAKIQSIEWECNYTDVETGAVTAVRGYKTISLSTSGGAIGVVLLELPKGDTFDETNATLGELTIEARLYRGSVQDTTIKSAVWKKLDVSTGNWVAVTSEVVSPLTGGMSKITVKSGDVLNFQSYKCEMTDQEENKVYSSFTTLQDATDPYTVEITGGDKIVNGVGSVTLNARVWRSGEIVEDGSTAAASRQFNYKWTKYNKDGTATNWEGTSSSEKTGNPVTVSAADVVVRATIYCEVSVK